MRIVGSSPFGVCAGSATGFLAPHHSAREGCPGHCGTLAGPGGNSGLRHGVEWSSASVGALWTFSVRVRSGHIFLDVSLGGTRSPR